MAFTGALGMVMGRFGKRDEVEIANVFKHVLKLEQKRSRLKGVRVTRWYEAGGGGTADGEEVEAVPVADVENAF
jgi:hypothetical protein